MWPGRPGTDKIQDVIAGEAAPVASPSRAANALGETGPPIMSDTDPSDECQRCRATLPVGDPRFVVRIDAEPPLSRPIAFWLCGPCMESMTRWARRLDRGGSRVPEGDADPFERLSTSRRGGGGGGVVRSIYAEELDRNERWIHRDAMLTLAGAVAAVGTLAGLVLALLRLRH